MSSQEGDPSSSRCSVKNPIKSALVGSLVQGALIQVQKVKVDLDAALSKIDRLLKSQELTFSFVGVAPSVRLLNDADEPHSNIHKATNLVEHWQVPRSIGTQCETFHFAVRLCSGLLHAEVRAGRPSCVH